MTTRTIEEWDRVLADLERERATALEHQGKLEGEAGGLALAASTGDTAAVAQLNRLDTAQDRARRIVLRLTRALEDAGRERAAAQQVEADAQAAARLGQQRELALVVDEKAAAADASFGATRRAMDEYLDAVTALHRAGADYTYFKKLRQTTKAAAAMHAAGLGRHIALPAVGASHHEPLRSWVHRIVHHLLPESVVLQSAGTRRPGLAAIHGPMPAPTNPSGPAGAV